jgi:hypothetical protein
MYIINIPSYTGVCFSIAHHPCGTKRCQTSSACFAPGAMCRCRRQQMHIARGPKAWEDSGNSWAISPSVTSLKNIWWTIPNCTFGQDRHSLDEDPRLLSSAPKSRIDGTPKRFSPPILFSRNCSNVFRTSKVETLFLNPFEKWVFYGSALVKIKATSLTWGYMRETSEFCNILTWCLVSMFDHVFFNGWCLSQELVCYPKLLSSLFWGWAGGIQKIQPFLHSSSLSIQTYVNMYILHIYIFIVYV